jgi:N-acetylmuramic acid 6-phosphate (MurNAc-6-P) etherase
MDHFETEVRNPDSANLDELAPIEFVHSMNAEDGKMVPAMASHTWKRGFYRLSGTIK